MMLGEIFGVGLSIVSIAILSSASVRDQILKKLKKRQYDR